MKPYHRLLRTAEQASCMWKAPHSSVAVAVVAEVRGPLYQGHGEGTAEHPSQCSTVVARNQRRRCHMGRLLATGAEVEWCGGTPSRATEP